MDPITPENGPLRVDQKLLSTFYAEFRQIARSLGKRYGPITLQPTELVHEAMLRLLSKDGVTIHDEAHFLALGARVIRTTLIDELRRRHAAKRDSDAVTRWDDHNEIAAPIDILRFDQLLDQLADIEPEGAKIVELRFYVGLTMEEIAAALSLSESTTLRRWRLARAWLFKELEAAA